MLLRAAQEPDGCDKPALPGCVEGPDDRRRAYHINDMVRAAPTRELTDFDVPLWVVGIEDVGRTQSLRSLELLRRGGECDNLRSRGCSDLHAITHALGQADRLSSSLG